MKVFKTVAAAALCVSGAMIAPAQAAVITMKFNEVVENVAYGMWDYCGSDGNVSYCDYTKGEYGNFGRDVLLGDDGFLQDISFTADPGTYFTPLRFDVLSARSNLFRAKGDCAEITGDDDACYGGEMEAEAFAAALEENPSAFEAANDAFLTLIGSRDGETVASMRVDPSKNPAISFGAGFNAIDTLQFKLNSSNSFASSLSQDSDGFFYGCAGLASFGAPSCNELRFDNLMVNTFASVSAPMVAPMAKFAPGLPAKRAAVAPVPLPASLWLLGGALGFFGIAKRAHRRPARAA